MTGLRIAQAQIPAYTDRDSLAGYLSRLCDRAVQNRADILALPEMFCCPYDIRYFSEYAQEEGGSVWQACSRAARGSHIMLSAGTMPELDASGHIYNTAYVFDPDGKMIAKHRKMHLFDIDIKGGQQFRESAVLSPGNTVTVFDGGLCTMGLAVCYDIRFPELFRLMAMKGAALILVPASFNMSTGPLHWELLFRSQSVYNEVFIAGTAPARCRNASYISWGHSIVTGPWGNILSQADEKEQMIYTDIDLDECENVRSQIPVLQHRRNDIYSLSLRSATQEPHPESS